MKGTNQKPILKAALVGFIIGIIAYCDRLNEIVADGGAIKNVQAYTVARQPAESFVEPLSDTSCKRIILHEFGWATGKRKAVLKLDPKMRNVCVIPLELPEAVDGSRGPCDEPGHHRFGGRGWRTR